LPIRLITIVMLVAIALGLWSLYPTFRLYFMMPGQEQALNQKFARAVSRDDSLRVQAEMAAFQKEKLGAHKRSIHLGLDLSGGMHITLEVDKSKLSAEEARDAADRALEVVRNRVDQFGVFEPVVQRAGRDRIVVQLPGVDRERAKNLIGQTAQLRFQLVQEERNAYDALKTIDDKLRGVAPESLKKDTGKVSDATKAAKKDTARSLAFLDTMKKDTATPVTTGVEDIGTFLSYVQSIGGDFGVDEGDFPVFRQLLGTSKQFWPQGYEFLFGPPEDYEGRPVRRLYMLKAEPEMYGSAIKDARPSPYEGSEPGLQNTWIVSLKLARKDAAVFAQVTGRNIGRRLAIVLDNVVKSAPVIQSRIPDGNAMITTNDVNPDDARDLAIVLRTGALPAPVNIVEERSVGPSLGRDSIRRGILAGLIGAAAVVLFMLIYYSAGGLLADLALVLNLFFLLVVLAGFRATLSLPGLAGIALTIGMAVDANILILERMREELRRLTGLRGTYTDMERGKEERHVSRVSAVVLETGYNRALATIIDSNATTIITAMALFFIGSGPIRGFAITLTAGLVINVFTAVFVTRAIYDWWLRRFEVAELRI
jgi:protein-export membrane protein SecD